MKLLHTSTTQAGAMLICAAMLAGVLGCSSAEPPPGPQAHPVVGKVLYKGRPAEGFSVAFHPVQKWDGATFAPSGVTDAAGEFQLRSYETNDGAPVGDYSVTITWPKEVPGFDPDDAPETVDQLRGAYNNPQRSKFQVTIHEGDNQLEPFALK